MLTSKTEVKYLRVDTEKKVGTSSPNSHKYFMMIIDEYRRYTETLNLKSKWEAAELLLNLIRKLEKQSRPTENKVRLDNGTEFTCAVEILDKQEVEITTITPCTPEINVLVKKTKCILLGVVRKWSGSAKDEKWSQNYAVQNAIDCRYLVPHSKTKKLCMKPYLVSNHQD